MLRAMTDTAEHAENAATDSYGALLFKDDPTGRVAVVMERVCDLSPEDYERFNHAYNVMFDMLVANMFTYVRQSSLDLFRAVTEASEAFRDGKVRLPHGTELIEWGTRIRTAILGVCSSIHHHQEQSYIAVKRKFGEDSPEHIKMKAAFAEIYDGCFGYRALFRLRHIMVHSTMLAAAMNAEARRYQGQNIAFVDMNMDRSVFLESKKISAALKDELRSLDEDPSIYELVGEAVPRLRDTNREVLAILHPEIDDVCATVREFDALFEGKVGDRALIHQQSPELRPPFTTGYNAWSPTVFDFAYARQKQATPTR